MPLINPPAIIAPREAKLEREAILWAFAQVESGGNTWKVGLNGERGLYQLREKTWYTYTSISFSEAFDPVIGAIVAWRHVETISSALNSLGFDPTAENVAIIWNAGIGNFIRHSVKIKSRDFAERVSRLYGEKRWPIKK